MKLQPSFWVGLIAAICIAVYMMPQLVKVIKTKDTSSISIAMFLIALIGDLFFVIDGILILTGSDEKYEIRLSNGLPILLANAIAFAISFIIAFIKIRNQRWAKHFGVKENDIAKDFNKYRRDYKEFIAKKKAAKILKTAKKEKPASGNSENVG